MADLFGKYQLLERVATGPVSEVFQAKSHGVEGFEKVVVIKRLRAELADEADFIQAFIDSAKKAVMLSHANVVQVFDLGQEQGCYYLAMEHVAGPNLGTVLRSVLGGAPIPLELCLWIAGELAKGLEHAHRRRGYDFQPLEVLHGGISPSNVLSSREGEVKLTDFGFTLAVRQLARSGGGPLADLQPNQAFHMAPEMTDPDATVDARADIFSVGAVLHHMLHSQPPNLGLSGREIPEEVAAISRQCLQPAAEARFPAAAELYEAIIAALFTCGWRPNPRTWSEFLAARTAPKSLPSPAESVELSMDDVLLIEDELTAEGLSALFDETTDPDRAAADDPAATRAPPSLPVAVQAPESDGSGRIKTPLPRVETVLARPSSRTSTPVTQTTHAVLAAVAGEGLDEELLLEHATRWGGRIIRIEELPPLVAFNTGSIPQRTLERALRFAMAAAAGMKPKPAVGVHMGTVGGQLSGEQIQPDHDDLAVVRAADLARAGAAGDVLVSEVGPGLLASHFAWSPPFRLVDGKVGHRVAHAETTRSITRRSIPAVASVQVERGSGERAAVRTRRASALVPPGREEDLAAILRSVEPVRGGSGRILVLEAEAGTGKSELLRAGRKALGRLEMSWFVARPGEHDLHVPFSTLRALVAEVCGFEEDDDADTLRTKLARLAQLGVGPEDVAAVEATFALREAPRRGSRDSVALLSSVLRKIAHALGQDRPVALVIEDGQHIDPESWLVIEELADRLEGARALVWILTTSPPPERLQMRESVIRRRLSPLGEEGRKFVVRRATARCGLDQPDPELVDALVARLGSDPRCLEAGVRLLADLDALEDTGVRDALPDNLYALIERRIGLLDDETRGILQQAAVVGGTFGLTLVARLVRQRRERVGQLLERAAGRGILEKLGPGRLAFRSDAFRESLYRSIEPFARREVHARIALELEALHQEDRERFVELLARHTSLSGDTVRALRYLERIADRFMEDRSPASALGPLLEAARLVEEDPDADLDRRIDLLLRVGDVARSAIQFDEARQALDKALELARAGRRERAVARILLGQGRIDLAEGRFDSAADLLGRALKLSDGLRDRGLVGRIYGALGETWQKNGDLVRAVDFLGKSVRVAEEEGDTTRLALLLPMLANAAGGSGDTTAAERWIVRALRTAEGTGDDLMRAKVLKAYSLLDYFGGRFEEGLERCVEALAIAEDVGSVEDAVILAHNAGDFCMQLGKLQRAYKFFTQSLELCQAHGLTRTSLTNEIHLTWLQARRHGDPPPEDKAAEVEPRLREQWSRAEALGLKWEALQARWFVARCLAARGKSDSARPLFEQVREGALKIHLQFLVRQAEAALEAL